MPPAYETCQYTAETVLSVDRQKRTIDVIISDDSLDSQGHRIDQSGWDFEQFKRNPVILACHDDMSFAVAKGLPDTLRTVGNKTMLTIQFPEEGKVPEADVAFYLYANGFMRAVSCGLQRLQWEMTEEEDAQGNTVPVMLIKKARLFEVSLVAIPANDNALMKARAKKLNADLGEVSLMAKKLEGMLGTRAEAVRWNRSLTKAFDVTRQPLSPANTEYDWVSKYIGCKVKEVFHNSFLVPSVRIGGFLTGLKNALGNAVQEEVRNILWNGTEVPPVYNVIQLNSTQSEDFLIDGISFYSGPDGKFAVKVSPDWRGLHLDVFTHVEAKQFNRDLLNKAWAYARENNPLKGEAFALSGEFIGRTGEGWDDCFLTEKNKKPLQKIVSRMNEKGKSFPNRGVIMTGPPGTGKTLSGRIIRNEIKDISFIWLSARDFHYAGGFGGIAHAFELAREIAPSVIFLEDVDNWIGGTTVDLLKTEMDGIARSTGVLTILTTNFPERLPDALIDRPGRFHDVLNFHLPTADTRKAMLEKWLEGLTVTDVQNAVEETEGYSGAHMYELASFARNLQESDDLSASSALHAALRKVEEQKELISQMQLQGSNYRHKPALHAKRNAGTLSTDMQQPAPADVEIWRSYFERKQPANKASTRVLAKFYKLQNGEPPKDEVEAWKVVEGKLEEVLEAVKEEEAKAEAAAEEPAEEKPADAPVEATPEPAPAEQPVVPAEEKPAEATPAAPSMPVEAAPVEPAPAEVPVTEVTPEPSIPTPPAAADPQPEQKSAAAPRRHVHITLAALQALPRVLGQAYAHSAVAALRRGDPVKDLDGILDAAEKKLLASLIS